MNQGNRGFAGAITQIQAALGQILQKHSDCGSEAGVILSALSQLQAEHAHIAEQAGLAQGKALRIRNKPKRYEVREIGGEEFLAEYRQDSSVPFRCPKQVIDATAKVLASSKQPLKFADVEQKVGRDMGELPADYLVRVALRFLVSELGLAEKHRARYTAAEPKTLLKKYETAWAQARKG